MTKIGRNQPCPCGSGKKYKKCCGHLCALGPPTSEVDPNMDRMIQQKQREIEAERIQREKQQGLGKQIISAELNDHRIVAVGNKLCWSKKWKTFQYFLRDHVIDQLGHDWFKVEVATSDGRHIMATSPMTDAELAAWKRYPDTFFGEVRHVGSKAENWLELCEFFYESYKDTPRDKLLEWMKDAFDIENLRTLSQEDLAIVYCERSGWTGFHQSQKAS